MSGKGVINNNHLLLYTQTHYGTAAPKTTYLYYNINSKTQQISAIIFYTVHSRGTNKLQARASRGPKSELHAQGRSIG